MGKKGHIGGYLRVRGVPMGTSGAHFTCNGGLENAIRCLLRGARLDEVRVGSPPHEALSAYDWAGLEKVFAKVKRQYDDACSQHLRSGGR